MKIPSGLNLSLKYWKMLMITASSGVFAAACGSSVDSVTNATPAVGRYLIRAAHSEQCLDIPNASKDPRKKITQYPCNASNAQIFEVRRLEGDMYSIKNFDSSMSLDIADASKSPGARLQTWKPVGGDAQKFIFENASNGEVIIRPVISGLAIDVDGFSNKPGAEVLQWNRTGAKNQRFLLQPANRPRFQNPLANGWEEADPSLVATRDKGYFRVKSGGPGVIMSRASKLTGFSRDTFGVDRRDAVALPSNICAGLWAPELQEIDGSWYIYFAAVDATLPGGCANGANRRMFVVKGDGNDPWTANFRDFRVLDTGGWAIDGVVMKHPVSKEFFLVFAGSIGKSGDSWSSIFIKRMRSPVETVGSRLDIGKNFPHRSWEIDRGGWGTREGPEVLIHGDRINVIYSAASSWDNTYCLANFNTTIGEDLMNPNVWRLKDADRGAPMNGCQFDRNSGAGHNSFFTSPDGQETWMTYHRFKDGCTTGWSCRQINAKRIRFNDDNTPDFGVHSQGDFEPGGSQ